MTEKNYYVYCFVENAPTTAALGIDAQAVECLNIQEVGVVVSEFMGDTEMPVRSSRKNLLTHQQINEEVLQQTTVLPLQFGVVLSATQLDELITQKAYEIKQKLNELDGKIELSLKGIWKDMPMVFEQIVAQNPDIQQLKQQALTQGSNQTLLIEIGQRVERALQMLKEDRQQSILDKLLPLAHQYQIKEAQGEAMFASLVFLIERSKESEFDQTVQQIGERYQQEADFKYIGPSPAFHFVDLSL